MNKNSFLVWLSACNIVIIILLGLYFFVPVSAGVTLYMYQDKPAIASKVASMIEDCESVRYVNQSQQYVYTYPQKEPWCEYIYVIRGKASRFTLHRIDSKYRINCYNLSTVVNPDFSTREQALTWSKIK